MQLLIPVLSLTQLLFLCCSLQAGLGKLRHASRCAAWAGMKASADAIMCATVLLVRHACQQQAVGEPETPCMVVAVLHHDIICKPCNAHR
jgi:hypothetical protein